MAKEISTERKNELYDENYFWDYGSDPAKKKLIEVHAQVQTDRGGLPDLRVLVYGAPARWLPFRDFDDFVSKTLNCNTTLTSLLPVLATYSMVGFALKKFNQAYPVGKYGMKTVRSTPFYRKWGFLSFASLASLPMVFLYFHVKAWIYASKMFYNRVILQDRDWLRERSKFNNPWGAYLYADHPLSEQSNFPLDAAKLIEQRNKEQIKPPKLFKEE